MLLLLPALVPAAAVARIPLEVLLESAKQGNVVDDDGCVYHLLL